MCRSIISYYCTLKASFQFVIHYTVIMTVLSSLIYRYIFIGYNWVDFVVGLYIRIYVYIYVCI